MTETGGTAPSTGHYPLGAGESLTVASMAGAAAAARGAAGGTAAAAAEAEAEAAAEHHAGTAGTGALPEAAAPAAAGDSGAGGPEEEGAAAVATANGRATAGEAAVQTGGAGPGGPSASGILHLVSSLMMKMLVLRSSVAVASSVRIAALCRRGSFAAVVCSGSHSVRFFRAASGPPLPYPRQTDHGSS